MKYWSLIIFSSYFTFLCNANQTAPMDKMIGKICAVVKERLKVEEIVPNKRLTFLKIIKNKLIESAKASKTETLDHINLIVQGIAILSDENNFKKLCTKDLTLRQFAIKEIQSELQESQTKSIKDYEDENGKTTQAPTSTTKKPTVDDVNSKRSKIKHVLNKLALVIEKTLKRARSTDEQRQGIEKVKEHILQSLVKQTNQTIDFKDLISEGIDLTAAKILANDSRRMSGISLDYKSNASVVDKIGIDIAKEAIAETMANTPEASSFFRVTDNKITSTVTSNPLFIGLTKNYGCFGVKKDICIELKAIDVFKCEYDDTTLLSQQVCDGVIDCPDGSDEKNCIKQVISKVHSATNVMSKVELSRSCFQSLADNTLLTHQGELLYTLLKQQIEFLNKYDMRGMSTTEMTPVYRRRAKVDAEAVPAVSSGSDAVNDLIAEVAVVVRTFATALNGALCSNIEHEELESRVTELVTDNIDDDLKDLVPEKYFPARLCDCMDGPLCTNSTCLPRCKRVCFLKFSFGRFNCKTSRNENSISLDAVCDGKMDCYDNLDEANCVRDDGLARFEGSRTFDNILRIIKSKAISLKYEPARKTLIELYAEVQTLQKRSMALNVNLEVIKTIRENCINLLKMILVEMMSETGVKQGEAVYEFLYSLYEKLILAMMRTHMGNVKVKSPEQCICRGAECAHVCSKSCTRLCQAKFVLTNYGCGSGNMSVPLNTICDGKINCPKAEDEMNCQSGICHLRHIKDLHNSIQNVGANYKNSILGDALDSWKAKALATLALTEYHVRLTPKIFRSTVSHVLNDLTLAYMSLENFKRLDLDLVKRKFITLSRRIIDMLKICNK